MDTMTSDDWKSGGYYLRHMVKRFVVLSFHYKLSKKSSIKLIQTVCVCVCVNNVKKAVNDIVLCAVRDVVGLCI